MPVKRRVSKRREALSENAEQWLRNEPCGFFEFKRKEELAALWAEHSDRIVDEHVAKYPKTRPHRWWQYSAPEPRQNDESEVAYLKRHSLFLPAEASDEPKSKKEAPPKGGSNRMKNFGPEN